MSLRAPSLTALLLVALCQFCLPQCTSADLETVARFRREYPQAGKRIEDVYSHIAISSRCRYFEAGKFRSESMFDFVRDGPRFRLIQEMLTTHTQPFGARHTFLMSDSYFFAAHRRDPASETILGKALPASESRRVRALSVCFDVVEPPPLNLYGYHGGVAWSHTFLSMFDWEALAPSSDSTLLPSAFPATLVDAETVQDGDKELVKLHCKTNSGHSAEFTLSPSDQWVVVAYRLETSEERLFTGKHEFEGTHKDVPLIKSSDEFHKWKPEGKREFRETSLKAEVMFIDPERELSAALFEPEAIGIRFAPPNSPEAEGTTNLKWRWLLLAGSLFVLLVGLKLRRRARSSNVTRETCP